MNWGVLIVGGFALLVLAQIAGSVLAFRSSPVDGVLSLLIPGYILLALKRANAYWPVVSIWLAGVIAVATGTIALS